ncbi:MAG TPA: hypothetical protein VGI63_00175 [Verrucomicrobiae bacterium]|jgi:hypothetical protein
MKTTLFLLTVAALIFAGCATHGVDWNARVGTFTYDQAVVELGPPDKTAKLTDGQNVAEWISRYQSGGMTTAFGTGYYNGSGGVSIIQSTPAYRESKLRLTFTTNNILAAWTRN